MNTILVGDALEKLRELPDGCVQMCVTSPPYWGLRDYGTAKWEGGDENCEHTISMPKKWNDPKRGVKYSRPEVANRGGNANGCFKCGAKRIDNQLGLEKTPEEFVKKLVAVFREVRRVLRSDGTLWLNLGDSYVSTAQGTFNAPQKIRGENKDINVQFRPKVEGLKPKDLVGIPWRVAFALQADGWYLRQDIIWSKPNPMPESIRDRCTKSHEYIFLLSKSKNYFYDHEAIMEDAVELYSEKRATRPQTSRGKEPTPSGASNNLTYNKLRPDNKRNKRSVWQIATRPFPGAHFAVFPPEIPTICIKAGSREGDIVLDPFFGAGTTGLVAKKAGRKFIGIELSEEYAELARKRLAQEVIF